MTHRVQQTIAEALYDRVLVQYDGNVRAAARDRRVDEARLRRWSEGVTPKPIHYEELRELLGLPSVYDLGPYLIATGTVLLEDEKKRPGNR